MAKINYQSIRTKVAKSKSLRERVDKKAENIFLKSKNQYINQFENHPITREISTGPESRNISNTLGGIGNLFSFIGFEKSSDPIARIRDLIKNSFSIEKKGNSIRGSKITFNYKISYPDLQNLDQASPMPWESGRSWVSSIEKGISGFGYYMYKKFNKSRSGTGIQTESQIRSGSFKPVKYMSQIVKDFVNNMRKK